MAHQKSEVPGNALATAAMTERLLSKTGHAVHAASYRMEVMDTDGIRISRISVRAKNGPAGEWFAVVNADTVEGAIVAFHTADSFHGCIEGLCNRLMNGSFKWKEDEYAK